MGEVRKLQKKLRQIENLEIKISLAPEERFKVQIYLLLLMSARLLARIDAQYIPPPPAQTTSLAMMLLGNDGGASPMLSLYSA